MARPLLCRESFGPGIRGSASPAWICRGSSVLVMSRSGQDGGGAGQHGSTATGQDGGAPWDTPRDGDLRGWTRVDVLPPDGMQEVWGSNPHSSTQVQKRNSKSEPLTEPFLRGRTRGTAAQARSGPTRWPVRKQEASACCRGSGLASAKT